MSDRWIITQGKKSWAASTAPTLALATGSPPSFQVKENPTQTGEQKKKPIFEVDTINGQVVYLTPCVLPGKPLPVNKKLQLKFEHLFELDKKRFDELCDYDLDFWMQTNNFQLGVQGRKMRVRILDMNTDWLALYYSKQVYGISITVHVIESIQ